jgi:Protein of unknown function (DUF3054)
MAAPRAMAAPGVTTTRHPTSRRAALAFGVDILAVVVFVAIGRRSHDESGNAVLGALRVAAPFLIALAVGWLVARAHRAPLDIRSGLIVWACTVAIGLALRRTVFDRGVAVAFIIVATITLGVLLIGWRALAKVVGRPARPV